MGWGSEFGFGLCAVLNPPQSQSLYGHYGTLFDVGKRNESETSVRIYNRGNPIPIPIYDRKCNSNSEEEDIANPNPRENRDREGECHGGKSNPKSK